MAQNNDQPSHKSAMTDFGYKTVPTIEKASKVAQVFDNVASKYDIMNDFMSLGLHRLWKQQTINQARLRPGQTVLDVAAGTGDLARAYAKIVGSSGAVIVTDINEHMLQIGRERLNDSGIVGNVSYVQADAQCLPFKNNHFDCISIAFGLRNVTDKMAALKSMYRILKPGGKLLILEFSHPTSPVFAKLYDFYSFNFIPLLGELVANDRESYQYLVESIRMHPNQQVLKQMLEQAGYAEVKYSNFSGGIVALHQGLKY
jgi:demethylmenaquinone methyltransferase / 2-methoxy-6-polyprenyl-1,4-benzoquinol methylase